MSARLDNLKAQRIAAGYSISRLASLSNTSDATITGLEALRTSGNGLGGTCTHVEADRICTALGISRGTAGFTDHT